MANYLLKYVGTYRVLPEIDRSTGDFPRDFDGSIVDDDIYITCQNNIQIKMAHLDSSRRMLLSAYIPSIGRGRNIKKALDEQGIFYIEYEETDAEVIFLFKAADIEPVAKLLKAKTSGAGIRPFSSKNLPKRKDIVLPEGEIARYKEITSKVDQGNSLLIHSKTLAFLSDVLEIELKKGNKEFSYKKDMRKQNLARQTKEYIWTKGYWDRYLEYLDQELSK